MPCKININSVTVNEVLLIDVWSLVTLLLIGLTLIYTSELFNKQVNVQKESVKKNFPGFTQPHENDTKKKMTWA